MGGSSAGCRIKKRGTGYQETTIKGCTDGTETYLYIILESNRQSVMFFFFNVDSINNIPSKFKL